MEEDNPIRQLEGSVDQLTTLGTGGRNGLDTYMRDLRHGKRYANEKELDQMVINGVVVVGQFYDLKHFEGLLEKDAQHEPTREYFNGVKLVIHTNIRVHDWFDQGSLVTVFAKNSAQVMNLYNVLVEKLEDTNIMIVTDPSYYAESNGC